MEKSIQLGAYNVFADTIGSGGQGTVLKGEHRETGKKVAIKSIDMASTSSRLSFEAEYHATTKLSSSIDHVCKIEDVITENGYGYLVMKHYDCDLFAYAFEMRENLIPEAEVKIIFTKICKGVRNLHKAKVAHLDLKPENILLDLETLEPYICDFGSAFTSSSTKSSRRKTRAEIHSIPALGNRGTRKFSSPEKFLSPNEYDPFRADIFSLGVILHILLTGYYPKTSVGTGGEDIYDYSYGKSVMSAESYDLLISLTKPSPISRMCIDNVLNHPWIKPKRRKSIVNFGRMVARSCKT